MAEAGVGLAGAATGAVDAGIGFALGFALARVLEPAGTKLRQEAWGADGAQIRALDPGTVAQVVAEDVRHLDWGLLEATYSGMNQERFEALLGEVLNAPGFAELVTMLRRGTIGGDDFLHGLRKAKLEGRWDDPLSELRHERLDPEQLAVMVQRGIVDNPGLLPVGPPSEVGRVPPMPQAGLDVLKEAAAHGLNEERIAALARIVGLPASPDLAARMVFRAIIDRVDFDRAISEGNTRNEWAPFLFEAFRQILTPHEYVEGHLRGWITLDEMYAGCALHGMSKANAELLFKTIGRPITVHAITTGLARGGEFGGDYEGVPEPYNKALRESNVRPEWGNLAYANRYTYPSAFAIRALATSGELSPDEIERILLEIGWRPDLAAKVTAAWTGGTKAKADSHVGKAETQLWSALHKAYIAEEIDDATLSEKLDVLGVAADAKPTVTHLWQEERELVRRELTPSQVKKAFRATTLTRDAALGRLERLHMSPADAATFLDE